MPDSPAPEIQTPSTWAELRSLAERAARAGGAVASDMFESELEVSHKADGKRYLYRAKVRRGDCVRKASRSFLERVFGGQAAPALLHFAKTAQLSAEEVAEIRALLDEMDQGR